MVGGNRKRQRGKSQAVKIAEANARQAKRNAQRLYKEHIKTMRPYLRKLRKIDLRKDLSAGQKSFIAKAYKEFTEATTRPVKIIRPRSKERLKVLQEFAGQTGPKFDVAFYPAVSPKAKVVLRKTPEGYTVTEIYGGVRTKTLRWNIKRLAADPDAEIARVLRQTDAQLFIIKVGKFLFNGGLSRSLVPGRVKELMYKYDDPTSNHYYQRWLFGLEAYKGTDKNIAERRKEYRVESRAARDRKAKERRRDKSLKPARPRKRTKRN